MFLLLELRKKTKGEVLEFKIDCPKCKSQSLNRVNLDALKLTKLDNEDKK
jgi:TusA-related sulfurtransferase